MNAASIILLVLISIWAVFSAVYSHKHSGSCGGCSGCDVCKRDGGSSQGEGLDGEAHDGEVLDGEAHDGEVREGEVSEGEAHEGKVFEGEHSDAHVNTYKCSGSCGTCPYHMK